MRRALRSRVRPVHVLLALTLSSSLAAPTGLRADEERPAPVAAVDDRLRVVQERRGALERELQRLRGEERSLLGDVERLDAEVRLRGEELREAQLRLEGAQAQLDETLQRVRALDEQLRLARPALVARARALYKLGELSYLRLLLSVERPQDFLRGYRFVTALARRDKLRLAAFRADQRALQATRLDLEQRTRAALDLRAELDRRRRTLLDEQRRKTELLTRIVERKETHAAYVGELQQAEAQLERLVGGLAGAAPSVPIAAFRGLLPWPVEGVVRAAFGRRKHARFDTYTVQNGIEIAAPAGSAARAVHEGSVVFADRFRGYGLMVIVDHGSKHHSLYAHLAGLTVAVGERVAAGQTLGVTGADGLEGPGLHFELRVQGKAEDPSEWLKRAAR